MNNNLVLPLLALILTVLSALFPLPSGGDAASSPVNRPTVRSGSIIAAIAVILFALATLVWPKTYEHGTSLAIGLGLGALVGVVAAGSQFASRGFVIGLATLGAAVLHFDFVSANAITNVQIAFVAGAFIGSFAASGISGRSDSGFLASVAALLIVSADYLGREGAAAGMDAASWSGVVLGLCVLVGHLVGGVVAKSASSRIVWSGIAFILLAVIGHLACWKYLGNITSANLWFGGAVVGGIIHLILAGGSKDDSFRFILAAVIWLGAATVAFAVDRGYGMSLAVLGGAGVLVLLGDIRGLMTLSVVAAILVYRLFREIFPSEARALDIGQHYTMIGLVIGALLPLLPIEWGKARALSGWREGLTNAMWLVLLLGLPVGAAMLLGPKGAIGMVVGLSFAAIVEALRGVGSLATMSIAAGIGSVTILTYNWLGDWADLDHNAKVRMVWIIAALSLILAGAFFVVTRKQATEPERQ
jgi:hypothetical protein